jgi:hypothetical protein
MVVSFKKLMGLLKRFTKKLKHVKACANNKCNLITLGGVNEVVLIVLKQCLTSKGNCKRYSRALRKMASTVLLKHGNNDGIAVYIRKETILKDMAAKN